MIVKKPRKLSTTILVMVLLLAVAGVFASNVILKKQYDKIDKSDRYWNFTRVIQQPFSHVKITGPALSKIIFEPNKTASARVSNFWDKAQRDSVLKLSVNNDTLYINFSDKGLHSDEREWLAGQQYLRIFAPQLKSVSGNSINFSTENLSQNDIAINVSGRSTVDIETQQPHFTSVAVSESDSSKVKFFVTHEFERKHVINFDHLTADLKGGSVLNIGNADAKDMTLNIADGSTIVLSGKSLKGIRK